MRNIIKKLNFAEHIENIWWSYDDKEFSIRENPHQIYIERSNIVSRPVGTLYEECLNNAKAIRNSVNGKIAVLYSGGIDSEIVVQSFFESKIPIDIYIVRFNNNLNLHDISWATKFCDDRNLSYTFLDLNINKWLDGGVEEYALPVKCQSPQIPISYWAVNQIDDYVVSGDGDLCLRRYGDDCLESYGEKWGLSRWMLHTNHPGCPKFYRFTSECEAAYMLDPTTEDFVNIASYLMHPPSIKFFKPYIFQKYFKTRYREKYTGFEFLKEECKRQRQNLQLKIGRSDYYISADYKLLKDLKTKKDFDWNSIPIVEYKNSDICDDNSKHMMYKYEI